MPDSAATTSRLSSREREIAELVASGKSNRAIAESLYLSERTVERHVSAIFNKLEVHSRAELISAVFAGALQTDAPSSPGAADAARLLAAIGGLWRNGGLSREGMARCETFLRELPRLEPRLLSELGAH